MQCYHGWHIPLAILALLSMLGLGLVILIVAATLHFKFLRRKVLCSCPSALILAQSCAVVIILCHHHALVHLQRLHCRNFHCAYTIQLQFATIEKLEPFSWALTYGLKEKYKWWSLVDLICRYFFILIVICTAGNKVSVRI